jgi:putative phosphonate metabolism protein
MAARYAIYAAPERNTRLWAFGTSVLGRDPETGGAVPQIAPDGFSPEEWRTLTASPRRYGFHATLKPPFALAAKRSEEDLFTAVRAFAAPRPPIAGLSVRPFAGGSYVMLGLTDRHARVHELADACVADFDAFRAQPSDAELARRQSANLSEREQANLARWGYPYVFDTFKFHLTLAGPLPGERAAQALSALETAYDDAVKGEGLAISSLAVFVEPAPGEPFRLALRAPLEG